MKLITAIIKPFKLDDVKEALQGLGLADEVGPGQQPTRRKATRCLLQKAAATGEVIHTIQSQDGVRLHSHGPGAIDTALVQAGSDAAQALCLQFFACPGRLTPGQVQAMYVLHPKGLCPE